MSARKALAHIKESAAGADQADYLLTLITSMGDDPYVDQSLEQIRKSINKIQGHAAIAQKAVTALIEQRKKKPQKHKSHLNGAEPRSPPTVKL